MKYGKITKGTLWDSKWKDSREDSTYYIYTLLLFHTKCVLQLATKICSAYPPPPTPQYACDNNPYDIISHKLKMYLIALFYNNFTMQFHSYIRITHIFL